MPINNRRLKEIQSEKRFYIQLLEQSKTKSESLTYKGKLEILEKEEKEILEKTDKKSLK